MGRMRQKAIVYLASEDFEKYILKRRQASLVMTFLKHTFVA